MKRHEMDPLSLVSGLMFTAIGAVFLFGRVDVARAGAQWAWPALLVAAGGLLMVLTARPVRAREGQPEADDESAAEPLPPEERQQAPQGPDEV